MDLRGRDNTTQGILSSLLFYSFSLLWATFLILQFDIFLWYLVLILLWSCFDILLWSCFDLTCSYFDLTCCCCARWLWVIYSHILTIVLYYSFITQGMFVSNGADHFAYYCHMPDIYSTALSTVMMFYIYKFIQVKTLRRTSGKNLIRLDDILAFIAHNESKSYILYCVHGIDFDKNTYILQTQNLKYQNASTASSHSKWTKTGPSNSNIIHWHW